MLRGYGYGKQMKKRIGKGLVEAMAFVCLTFIWIFEVFLYEGCYFIGQGYNLVIVN